MSAPHTTLNAVTATPCLFVYGTLMVGRGAHHLLIPGGIQKIVPASVEGIAFELGGYPALKKGPGPVEGQAIFFRDLDSLFPVLDEYEGALYRREIAEVSTETGEAFTAWLYVLAG